MQSPGASGAANESIDPSARKGRGPQDDKGAVRALVDRSVRPIRASLATAVPQRLKPGTSAMLGGTTEVVPFHVSIIPGSCRCPFGPSPFLSFPARADVGEPPRFSQRTRETGHPARVAPHPGRSLNPCRPEAPSFGGEGSRQSPSAAGAANEFIDPFDKLRAGSSARKGRGPQDDKAQEDGRES